jgi:CubicO group peptidase (beta-lactamase class C family)
MRARTLGIVLGVVVVLAVVLIPRLLKPEQVSPETYWPTQGWRTSTPEEQGLDSGKLAEGLQAMRASGLDSLLIARNGHVVLDAYYYPYDDTIPHKLASVTKSVMTTLVGITVDQGRIQLDQALVSFFPDRTIANLDARKERITIRHLVSMRNGFASGCLTGDEPTLDTMRSHPDWVQAALDRKMAREPGTSFCYDSPGMHLLSAILQEATGMTALDFARQNLFEPLGIGEVFWQSDPQGYTHGWGDLYLKPRDAAKIGYLWLNNGIWEGRQIVSATWVADSVTAHSNAGDDSYGYGWWVSDDSYFALGRGGQNITTGSGFEYDQVAPMLVAAFVDPDKPLPANPAGVAKLEETLTALAEAPNPWPVGPVPDIALTIAGTTYLFEPNSVDLATLRVEFDGASQVTFYMKLEGRDVIWPVDLDGTFRPSSTGQGVRGYWADPQTLVVEVFEDGLSSRWLRFEEDRVDISSPELGLKLEGGTKAP